MSDRRKPPHDRDRYIDKHTPATGVPEAFAAEDVTGRYEGEELLERRRKRTTADRLEHLENKYDELVKAVVGSRTKIIVALVGAIAAVAGYLIGGCA